MKKVTALANKLLLYGCLCLIILLPLFEAHAQYDRSALRRLIFINRTDSPQRMSLIMTGIKDVGAVQTKDKLVLDLKPGRNEYIVETTPQFDGAYSYVIGGKTYKGIVKKSKSLVSKRYKLNSEAALDNFLNDIKKQTGFDPYGEETSFTFIDKGERLKLKPGINVVLFPKDSELSLKSNNGVGNAWFLGDDQAYKYDFNNVNAILPSGQAPKFLEKMR